jgi:hypothetical protein
VVSSIRNDRIWYNRCNRGDRVMNCVMINYPAAERRGWGRCGHTDKSHPARLARPPLLNRDFDRSISNARPREQTVQGAECAFFRRFHVLNNCGLPATYSAQSSLMIRSTSSELKSPPSGCLLLSRPTRKIPENGSPGDGVKDASVGSWIMPCREMLNWSRLTRHLSMIVFAFPPALQYPLQAK